jgi:hypothetical protein
MAGVGHRAQLYTDAVAFPTSKTAAAATITGSQYFAFEASGWGGVNIVFSGDTVSGDTITINTYVSLDDGGSWVQVDEDTVGHNSTFAAGGGASSRRFFIPFAPRVRIDQVYDAAATLAAGHGLNADIEMLEYDPEAKKTLFTDVLDIGDTAPLETYSIAAVNGDTMAVNNPTKIMVWCRQADAALFVGDSLEITVQGSTDASNWFDVVSLSTARPQNGDSIYRNVWEIVERPDFPAYIRLKMEAGDSLNEWDTGHGTQFYVLAME